MQYKILEVLAILSAIFAAYTYWPYVLDIVRRKTIPHSGSWFIWSVLSVIILSSQLSLDADFSPSFYLFIAQVIGISITFFVSVFYGITKFSKSEFTLLYMGMMALAAWNYFNNSEAAIVVLVAVDIIAGYFTVRKTFESPDSETPITWWGNGIAALFAVLVINDSSNWLYVYPIYTLALNISVLVAIYHRKLRALLWSAVQSGVNRSANEHKEKR